MTEVERIDEQGNPIPNPPRDKLGNIEKNVSGFTGIGKVFPAEKPMPEDMTEATITDDILVKTLI